jgi:tripartite-type tricarboxylate transporter receptor subunit TctC
MSLSTTLVRDLLRRACASLVGAAVVCAPAFSADYPTRPIRLIIGFAPGGLTDINGRVFAAALQKKFGQPVVVENRPGAGGAIGREAVSKAAPDGYTLLTEPTTILGYAVFTKNPTFDVQKDLAPVSILTEGAFVLVASASTPFKTFEELISYAKANPGKLNYSSNGPGIVTL